LPSDGGDRIANAMNALLVAIVVTLVVLGGATAFGVIGAFRSVRHASPGSSSSAAGCSSRRSDDPSR